MLVQPDLTCSRFNSGFPADRSTQVPGYPNASYSGYKRSRGFLLLLPMFRLDYLSCALTILSTCLVSRRMWQGWVVASLNSVIICVIGFRTAQLGFVPANLFCLALYMHAIYKWTRRPEETASPSKLASHMSRRCGKISRSRSASSARMALSGERIRSSGAKPRVPVNNGTFDRDSDRVLSRTLPAQP
jgi:hypothetical protein